MKIVLIYIGVSLGTILFTILFIFLFCPVVFFNGFIKSKIENSFKKSNPGYSLSISSLHYKFWNNKIEADTIRIYKNDSVQIYRIIGCSVAGIRFNQLLSGGPKDGNFNGYVADAKEININNKESKYEMNIKAIHVSVDDSIMVAKDFEYHPTTDDEKLFAANQFRQTRVKIKIPSIKLSGTNPEGLINNKKFHARLAKLNDMSVDILLNKDKPCEIDTAINPMPNELFNKIKNPFQFDSITIENGQLSYNERFEVNGQNANLSFNHINIKAAEINDTLKNSTTAIINGNGIFNNTTPLNLSMIVPLSSKDFSLKYSGTWGEMDLTNINHYLDIAEAMRVKSGRLESASFNVDITNGYASGNVKAIYTDLKLEPVIGKQTKSKLRTNVNYFLLNSLMIHKNNIADKKGNVKPGEIKYMRGHDTAFMEMIWFSLRSGIIDISGI